MALHSPGSIGPSITVPGSDTEVIFNDGGAFGADADFTYDKTTNTVTTSVFQVGTAYPIKTLSNNNEIAIGPNVAASATGNTSGSLFLGKDAGSNSQAINSSIMIGEYAGQNATYSGLGPMNFGSTFIGFAAGASSSDSYGTIALGYGAAGSHTGYRVIAIGENAMASTSTVTSTGIGEYCFEFSSCAGNLGIGNYSFQFASASEGSIGIGPYTGAASTNALYCIFVGSQAGSASLNPSAIVAFGDSACYGANYANASIMIGALAGAGSTYYKDSIALGYQAGNGVTCASDAEIYDMIHIGNTAGANSTNSVRVICIGGQAGRYSSASYASIFIGDQSGKDTINANDCIFIGERSGTADTVDNSGGAWNILLGKYTNTGGFSNSIAIGGYIANSAASQCNIGNVLYIDGIYSSSTQSATPITTSSVGIGTDTPDSTLQVIGRTHTDTLQVNGGSEITNIWTTTATLDFPSIAHNGSEELTVTVTGAAVGDTVMLGPPSSIEAGLIFCGFVSAADTVTIRVHNSTGGTVDPASNDWRVTVMQFV